MIAVDAMTTTDDDAYHGGKREGAGRINLARIDNDGSRIRKNRADLLEVDINFRKVKLKREMDDSRRNAGDLIPYDEVKREFAEYVSIVEVGLETLPDRVARDTGLSGEIIVVLKLSIDRIRRDLHARLAETFGNP